MTQALTRPAFPPIDRYLLFYRPQDDGIELVRVLHASRDVKALFH